MAVNQDDVSRCVIIGGGGHAAVLIDCIVAAFGQPPAAVLDADHDRHGTELLGVPILGDDQLLDVLLERGMDRFLIGIGSTSETSLRRALFQRALSYGLVPCKVQHPTAVVSSYAQIGGGSQVFAKAVVNTNARIGVNCIVNTGAIVEHDCQIGDHVHIAPGCTLSGDVHVDSGAHIGVGATVRQGIRIGEEALVAAGAVVVADVAPHSTVVGVPARQRCSEYARSESGAC